MYRRSVSGLVALPAADDLGVDMGQEPVTDSTVPRDHHGGMRADVLISFDMPIDLSIPAAGAISTPEDDDEDTSDDTDGQLPATEAGAASTAAIVTRYTCNICAQVFTERRTLTRHLNLHTGAKPFACRTCSRTFARRDTRDRHEIVHDPNASTTEKPCSRCGRSIPIRSFRGHKCHSMKATHEGTDGPGLAVQSAQTRQLSLDAPRAAGIVASPAKHRSSRSSIPYSIPTVDVANVVTVMGGIFTSVTMRTSDTWVFKEHARQAIFEGLQVAYRAIHRRLGDYHGLEMTVDLLTGLSMLYDLEVNAGGGAGPAGMHWQARKRVRDSWEGQEGRLKAAVEARQREVEEIFILEDLCWVAT